MTTTDRRPQTRGVIGTHLDDPDLFQHGFPHERFTALRREAPVSWHPIPPDFPGEHDDGFWVFARHADVQTANRDSELWSCLDGPQLPHQPAMRGNIMVSMDGAPHARLRRLISAGFTPLMVARLEEQARRWSASIVDAALERGTCNFVQDVAYQLPMHMIADIVGIPHEDRDRLFGLTNDLLLAGNPAQRRAEDALAVQIQLFQYAQELGRRKRSAPQDDVWTLLATVEVATDDGERTRLSDTELDLFFLLLSVAGSETTRNAISLGLLALVEHPEQLATLRREPAAMRAAVEEILRWSSPVAYFARRATRDTEVAGVKIAKGDRITMWYPSANRDEAAFADPFRFDIARRPNPHVSFGGGGAHFCLGANLARFEIAIQFEELLARTRSIEVIGAPRYAQLGLVNPVLLAMQELPVRLA